MIVKCVGGPMDGHEQIISDRCKVGEAIRIAEMPKFKLFSYIPSYEESQQSILIRYHVYILTDEKTLKPR